MKTTVAFALIFAFSLSIPNSIIAQSVLFNFDDAPLQSPFPISLTEGGITAHFSGTGESYSIQDVSAPVVPIGFSGRYIYPSSVFLADLLIGFDQTLNHFSIWYSSQELGCDDAATMRVTAYMNGNYIGTNTKTTANPGTWPVDSIACNFASGFDSVVVHYDSAPPTCQDYGVIFLADNMRVTAGGSSSVFDQNDVAKDLTITNPISQNAILSYSILRAERIAISVLDVSGRLITTLYDGISSKGEHRIQWQIDHAELKSGMYILKLSGAHFNLTRKFFIL